MKSKQCFLVIPLLDSSAPTDSVFLFETCCSPLGLHRITLAFLSSLLPRFLRNIKACHLQMNGVPWSNPILFSSNCSRNILTELSASSLTNLPSTYLLHYSQKSFVNVRFNPLFCLKLSMIYNLLEGKVQNT